MWRQRHGRGQEPETGIASALKDQVLLISFVVLFAGLVSTDTYYAAFGLRYQLLDLSVQHLVYRGLTALTDGWLLGLAYLLSIFWLAAGHSLAGAKWPRRATWLQLATYGVVILVTAVAYYSAIAAGREAAGRDVLVSRSRLPAVQQISDSEGALLPYSDYRLLLAGKDRIALFKPVPDHTQVPFIHILRAEEISAIVITR